MDITTQIQIPQRKRLRIPGELFWAGFVLFPLIFLLICCSGFSPEKDSSAFIASSEKDSTVTVTLSFVGDLMCHVPQITNAKKADGTYDFNPSFKEVTPYLSEADVTMGNLECTFAGKGRPYGGYPAFNSPDEYLAAIKNSGIDFLCTANNHSMDTGEEGLQRTLKKVRENNFASTGTFDSQRDRDSIRVLDVKGVKIAVLNYTYGTNGSYPAPARKWMLNVADSALVRSDVLRARNMNSDIVLVFYHWGIENMQSPVPKQDSMLHWAADAGADLVIGSHPHVLEPVEYYKTAPNAKLDSGIVAWSLGNFLSNQYWRYTDAGLILNISLEKNISTGKMKLGYTSYVPTWVYRSYDPSLMQHVVVPAQWCYDDSIPSWIKGESKTKMCEACSDTRKMMEKGVFNSEPTPEQKKEAEEILKKFKEAKDKSQPFDTTHLPAGGSQGNTFYKKASIKINVANQDSGSCYRTIISKPVNKDVSGEGNVEMILTVAKDGKVILAEKGLRGTTTTNSTLIAAARQLSYQVRFNEALTCPETMNIPVTFIFKFE
jgi:poly-gamma-glutamate capsule biosynthesis protein CapA/YwtB (metallophosphatase superfamily)